MPAIVKHNNEASRRRWFYFQEPYCLTDDFAKDSIMECQKVWNTDKKVNVLEDNCFLGIILKESGELIGEIGVVKRFRPEVHLDGLEIGYGISEAYQGHGYATEAAKAALEWVFEHFREIDVYPKIEAHVEKENIASVRVAKKASFQFDRNEEYVVVYSIDSKQYCMGEETNSKG